MAVMAGYNGNVLWMSDAAVPSDSTAIYLSDATHRLYSWKLDYTVDTVDSTDFTSTGWKAFTATLKTWGGSLETFVNPAKPLTIADVGSSATIQLYLSDALYYNGTAICTGIHPSVGVEGIETQTVDFQGTGALVLT